jgi:hypothetical protein
MTEMQQKIDYLLKQVIKLDSLNVKSRTFGTHRTEEKMLSPMTQRMTLRQENTLSKSKTSSLSRDKSFAKEKYILINYNTKETIEPT